MRVLALSPQSITESLAATALQSCLRRFLVSMETTQSGLEPCQTQRRFTSKRNQDTDW